jgi:tRNA nucleotidyltransferase (CCA-adding enzyme)
MTSPSVRVPARIRPLLGAIGVLADGAGCLAFAVGGCVRDWCLGLPAIEDVDIAVEGDAIALAKRLAMARRGRLLSHEQFGTASVWLPRSSSLRVDFAICRRERYAHPGAYPRVEAASLAEDLLRRDFAFNAMALSLQPERFGVLIDPQSGRGDLQARQIRVLHARSFQDDPSRILRGIRFAERFGFRWEPQTRRWLLEALTTPALGRLNAGRMAKEFGLMAQEPDPAACVRHLSSLLKEALG